MMTNPPEDNRGYKAFSAMMVDSYISPSRRISANGPELRVRQSVLKETWQEDNLLVEQAIGRKISANLLDRDR